MRTPVAALLWPMQSKRSPARTTFDRRLLLASVGLWLCLASASASVAQKDQGTSVDSRFDDLFDEEWDLVPTGYADPFESSNRSVFAFNRKLDQWILDPVTEAYRYAVPRGVRQSFSRVFVNLASTKTLVNDVLQLEWRDAGVTTARFLINTSLGLVGFFDVAAGFGLDGHESSFGQTLALAAVPSGPYLVFPVIGPGNIRDGVGMVVDGFFQPTYYIIGPANFLIGPSEILLYTGSSGISLRDRHYLQLKAFEESSVDFYSALRNGYYQQRIEEIWGNRDGHRTSSEPSLE